MRPPGPSLKFLLALLITALPACSGGDDDDDGSCNGSPAMAVGTIIVSE